ncbi:MAG: DMT family transporter [Gammaproteobacteria bacterium]|nr:DMT family transporter [Gammaproteobacteria bacterium]
MNRLSALIAPLCLVLTAFAANSLTCRIALRGGAADPLSFTAIRISSGAVVLMVILALRGTLNRVPVDPRAVLALNAYAVLFSFAYLGLDAATGALLLFAAVQITMVGAALWRGERPTALAWAGFAIASGGLVWLLSPGVTAPPLLPAVEMLLAGVGWGVYSLVGAKVREPLTATAWNFVFATPIAVLALAFDPSRLHLDRQGLAMAVLSGAVASGLGYALWYLVLPRLTALLAASAQLAVPVLAACGGVLILGEPFTPRLALSVPIILGGIGLVLIARHRRV